MAQKNIVENSMEIFEAICKKLDQLNRETSETYELKICGKDDFTLEVDYSEKLSTSYLNEVLDYLNGVEKLNDIKAFF